MDIKLYVVNIYKCFKMFPISKDWSLCSIINGSENEFTEIYMTMKFFFNIERFMEQMKNINNLTLCQLIVDPLWNNVVPKFNYKMKIVMVANMTKNILSNLLVSILCFLIHVSKW
jgi:hypothetical protein